MAWIAEHQWIIGEMLDALHAETGQLQASIAELTETLFLFMDRDRKSTALKAIQGMIWRQGYMNGDFKGHLYPDVPLALRMWQSEGIRLYVYSSGSTEAQKLLFRYSDAGDISSMFSGFFDTHVVAKRQPDAYCGIARQTGQAAGELLLLSDIHQELDAAQEASWNTLQLIRGAGDAVNVYRQIKRFDQGILELCP